jgi:putative transposase
MARGNNRTSCFFRDQDRRIYLRYLEEAARENHCEIYAFVLMTNHVHLLAAGLARGAISRMMQSVGRRHARYVNDTHGRTGALYDGRFKSSLIQTERYFLTCMRYIELNPVRAGMVKSPDQYAWSSFSQNALETPRGWLTAHPEYLRLGRDAKERASVYRNLFSQPLSDEDLAAIRLHARKNRALGSDEFRDALRATLGRDVGIVSQGRPRRDANLSPFPGEK